MSITRYSEEQLKHIHHSDDEHGYALLALLASMAILVILLSAAAPFLKHEAQREKELEAIRRGEQVAQAIRDYIRLSPGGNTLPRSIEDLAEGVSRGTKKVQVLRRSSMRDPLTSDGEWRLIKQVDTSALRSFCNDVRRYAETPLLPVVPTAPKILQDTQNAVCLPLNIIGIDEPEEPEELLTEGAQTSGPFVGVASKNQSPSIINYYGIDKHSRWIFTPLFR